MRKAISKTASKFTATEKQFAEEFKAKVQDVLYRRAVAVSYNSTHISVKATVRTDNRDRLEREVRTFLATTEKNGIGVKVLTGGNIVFRLPRAA